MIPHAQEPVTHPTCWAGPSSWLSFSVPGTTARGHSSAYPPLKVRATLLKALRFAFDWQVVRPPQSLATSSFFLLGLRAFVHTRRCDTALIQLPAATPTGSG
jgi:hypothetical protein